MWFSKIKLVNINGFSDTGLIKLSRRINVFVGQNNSGKSTIINTILLLQHENYANISVKIDANTDGTIEFIPENIPDSVNGPKYMPELYPTIISSLSYIDNKLSKRYFPLNKSDNTRFISNGTAFTQFPNTEPFNIIYPFLSRRKASFYNESINLSSAQSVTGTFENLNAKIDRLCNRFNPGHDTYYKVTTEIFGYPISVIETAKGKKAAYVINHSHNIPLTLMGEGVPNLLAFIVDLCLAENKIFLIEEPENDIHPKVLKSLLSLIAEKSFNNQFFISTHSNIVLKELGAQVDTRIFHVSMSINDKTKIPDSTIREVGTNKVERMSILEDLGYEFQDFELWKGWLFLEESSTERIIREYFIKWFIPGLIGRLKTFSARSKDEVKPKFDNFNNLFVFLHLEPAYKNKAWVVIDAGEDEKTIIDKMKTYYLKHGWHENKFRQFSKHNFEEYYPTEFKPIEEIQPILNIQDKNQKREAKKQILEELVAWIDTDEERAKGVFENSAKEVIDILKEIEQELKGA